MIFGLEHIHNYKLGGLTDLTPLTFLKQGQKHIKGQVMKYTISIDQVHTKAWELSLNHAFLFCIINDLSSWADEVIIEGKVFYFASRNMIMKEIPTAYSKSDTVYRALMTLKEKGLIDYYKMGRKDLIRLTNKGKQWNESEFMENDPDLIGQVSENNSDSHPTNKNTKIDQDTILSWRDDFEIYKSELTEVYERVINNEKWILIQEELHPGIDIKLSLKKGYTNFWIKQAGWKHKKKSRTKEIDWETTLINSIDINKVWKPRNERNNSFAQKPNNINPDPEKEYK